MQIKDLKQDKRNYRTHNKKNLDLIKKSVKEVGLARSIVIDNENNIICGNGLTSTLDKNTPIKVIETDGTQLVVVKRTDLNTDDEKRKQLAIMDNSTSDSSEFDLDILQADFDVEQLQDWGLDVEFESLEEKEIIEDEVPEEVETKCKLGDIWQLGSHRLMCGDSTSITDVEKLMDGEKADMVFTDPPYNMSNNFDTSTINLEKLQKRVDDIVNFNPDEIAYLTQLNICSFYIFTSKNLVPRYFEIFKDFDFNILVWCKDNPTPLTNYTFLPDVEYLLYFSKKGKIWNNGLDTTIYKKYYNGNKLEGRKEAGDVHPTVKPQKIIQDKIQISSSINGVVLDPFGGSGSTLIACEQLDRKCYMMELDPKYCDVILQRWENLTGEKAVLLNGEQ